MKKKIRRTKRKRTVSNLKMNICRSYVRKLNIGNFQTVDIFASFTEEILVGDESKAREVSRRLFDLAKREVYKDVENELGSDKPPKDGEKNLEISKLSDILEYNARHGIASPIADYEKIVDFPEITKKINEAKKAFNREKRPKNLAMVAELKKKIKQYKKIKYGK